MARTNLHRLCLGKVSGGSRGLLQLVGLVGHNIQSVTTILDVPRRLLNSLAELIFLVLDIVTEQRMVFVDSWVMSVRVLP